MAYYANKVKREIAEGKTTIALVQVRVNQARFRRAILASYNSTCYMDHWIDDSHFHWQSQNATHPSSKRGQDIIRHAALGIDIHLFVRVNKLAAGKAAPFTYQGRVVYESHQGSQPMSVVFGLQSAGA